MGAAQTQGEMASLEGFEPPTGRLEGGCSIRLSYRDVHDIDQALTASATASVRRVRTL